MADYGKKEDVMAVYLLISVLVFIVGVYVINRRLFDRDDDADSRIREDHYTFKL